MSYETFEYVASSGVWFVIVVIAVLWSVNERFVHMSCIISKITKKPICRCWDCKSKCELYKKHYEVKE